MKNLCVHGLFETQAGKTPDSVAVISGEISLSYGELNRRANQLAHYLKKFGAGPGVFVGICMGRSVEMVVGLLAILKSGGTYVPLDPMFPRERLGYMLEDTRAPLVISEKSLRTVLPDSSARMVYIDEDHELIREESESVPEVSRSPEQLAYVIFTSGSTGRPKGVQIQHSAVVNFLCSMKEEPGISREDILLSVATLSFDMSVLDVFLPLSVGAALVVATRADALDGTKLVTLLRELKITVMQATPTTWRLLLQAGWDGQARLKILCGGEALNMDLATQLLSRCGSLWNMYGPTETTVYSTVKRIDQGTEKIMIGRPIRNTQTYVLDENLEAVPTGTEGELFIGGYGVAVGYIGKPDLTNEKFILDPFSAGTGKRIYRTGDMARLHANGDLECLGRLDHQVKIRGYRIELGEIESRIAVHPSVRECVVVAREDRLGDQQLVAYVVPKQDLSVAEFNLHALAIGGESNTQTFASDSLQSDTAFYPSLRNHLREKLPDYMIPSLFMTLDALPLTPNGKIDRKALPAPDRNKQEVREKDKHIPARSATEQEVCRIWSEVLGVEQIGIHDNFFELGGHSLLVLRVLSLVNECLNARISPTELFENPTVAGLCAFLEQERTDLAEVSAVESPKKEATPKPSKVDLGLVASVVAQRQTGPVQSAKKRPYQMRESLICKWILAPLYRVPRGRLRDLIQWLILKLENGQTFTVTLRKLYAKHFDLLIGDYTTGCFDFIRMQRRTSVGRYTSIYPTVIIQSADHPRNTISTHALFYHSALPFADGYELPRTKVKIGNDVFIGHNATILYPTSEIGDGAVIAAGSVVTGDVPPYAIMGGYPAQVLRYRFSKEKIAELLQSRWWDASLEDLESVKGQFTLPLEGENIR